MRLHNNRMIVRTTRQSMHDCRTILGAHCTSQSAYGRVVDAGRLLATARPMRWNHRKRSGRGRQDKLRGPSQAACEPIALKVSTNSVVGSVTARHEAFAPRAGDVALMEDFRGWLDDHLEGSMARLREEQRFLMRLRDNRVAMKGAHLTFSKLT